MARNLKPEDLVGVAEISERLGLSHGTSVHSWRRRYPDFPAPIAQLHAAIIWNWPDVENWAKKTGRLA